MNYIKEYSTWDGKLEYPDETWVSRIDWLHNKFYDKLDAVQTNIKDFEETIDGIFYGCYRLQLQLGLATKGQSECFFMDESNLIVNPNGDEERTMAIIKPHSGFLRFDEKMKKIRNGRENFENDKWFGETRLTYPYYKYEGYFKIHDKETETDVERNTKYRYTKWLNETLQDLFPGWDVRTQIRVSSGGANLWIHLVDFTNVG